MNPKFRALFMFGITSILLVLNSCVFTTGKDKLLWEQLID